MVPVIETERLRLRGHEMRDFEASVAMWADPEVRRFIGGSPSTREDSWGRFLRYVGHWQALGFGFWVVEQKSDGRFAGEVGFADFKRDMTPGFASEPEQGWALASWAHGKGFATEAVRAALDWGDKTFKSDCVCMIDPGNSASIGVAQKAGYQRYALGNYKDKEVGLYRRSARLT